MAGAGDQQQHVEAFLEALAAERGAARNTLEAYRRDLEDFLAFLKARGRGLADAAPADIAAHVSELAAAGLAPASRARRLSAIRQLCKFLVREGAIEEDPASGIAGPRQGRPLSRSTGGRGRRSRDCSADRGGGGGSG